MSVGVFDTGHYATGLRQRLRRGFELGPRYFMLDIPRYLTQRRKLGLSLFDWEALWNPMRSFRNTTYVRLSLPPHYDQALGLLEQTGVRFDNPRSRIEALAGLWWEVHGVAGDVIECGTYRGATSLLLAALGKLNGVSQKVLMLDTFAGMPAPSQNDSSRQTGEFAPPERWTEVIAKQIAALGVEDRAEIHQGLFSETFPKLTARGLRLSFVHIDANIFQSTFEACEFTMPRLAGGGAVVFDDYNGMCDLGARLAIDSYLAGRGRKPKPLAECSAYLRT